MKRSILAPAAVLIVAVLTGGWFLQEGVEQDQNVYLQVRLFQEVIDHVSDRFVDEVAEEELYNQAIDGIIRDLGDPNSSFIRAPDLEDFRIRTEGDYGGVGLEIRGLSGEGVAVVSPIPGTPGSRSGIRAGDRFLRIGDQDVTGWQVDQAADLLRGEPGTTIEVTIERPGMDEPLPFILTRERIQIMAVPFSVILEDGIGYVPLQHFQETATSELRAAVEGLQARGMTGLILDLRGNPGGLLEEGIGVSDLFLGSGQRVVETRGRAPGQTQWFSASEPGSFSDLMVVVLQDEESASASEIVAGALQDHDRALVVGNSSWGKGSVQSLYPLSGGNLLRLTTARWYTPQGRSIHKERRRETFRDHGVLTVDGRLALRPMEEERPVFRSPSGRVLLGGGGIAPDVVVLPDTLSTDEQQAVGTLLQAGGVVYATIFNFAQRFILENPSLPQDFDVTVEMLTGVREMLGENGFDVPDDLFRRAGRYLRYQVGSQIAVQAFGEEAQFQRGRGQDRQLQRAQQLLRSATSTSELLRASSTMVADGAAVVGEAESGG